MQSVYKYIARKLQERPELIEKLLNRARRTPYSDIMSSDGNRTYMKRWWLFNPYETPTGRPTKRNWFMRQLPSIRIHHIMREDEERDPHDHPWDAQTIIMRGWYVEERPAESWRQGESRIATFWRDPGDTFPLRFGQYHRISYMAGEGVLTLFITFKYRGTWGFLVNGKKVPWREYLGIKS